MGRAHASMGERLRAARIEKQWTQEYVAGELGVEPITYARWERGLHRPHPFYHQPLCSLFGKTPEELGLASSSSNSGSGESSQEKMEATPPARVTVTKPTHLIEPVAKHSVEALTAFRMSDLTSRLEAIMWTWLLRKDTAARYHELQMQLMLELEDDNRMHDDPITRRDALRRLARLPVDYCGLVLAEPVLLRHTEEILATCAAGITACWYLRRGKDMAFADDTVSYYIPTLKEIAKSGEQYQAADLLAQAFLLKSVLAWAVSSNYDALYYAQQVEKYGKAAGNIVLQILAARTAAATYSFAHDWKQALHSAEKAKHLLETARTPIPHLVHSYVYAGLATYQAYHGKKQDALASLRLAHNTFFNQSHDETAPIWIDHHIGNLLLNDGETHLYLGLYRKADEALAKVHEQHANDATISATCFVATLTDRAMAEVSRDDQPRDMERCIDLWTRGIEGARMVQSTLRFNESVRVYAAMRAAWPTESRIRELRDLLIQ